MKLWHSHKKAWFSLSEVTPLSKEVGHLFHSAMSDTDLYKRQVSQTNDFVSFLGSNRTYLSGDVKNA